MDRTGGDFVSIAYYQTPLNARAFAEQLVKGMKVEPKYNDQEDGCVDFDAELNGSQVNVTITAGGTDGEAQVAVAKGDFAMLEKILDSVSF